MPKITYKRQFNSDKNNVELNVKKGQTLQQIIAELNIPTILNEQLCVYINGGRVLNKFFKYITPKENTHIKIVLIPAGGNASDVLRMVAFVVIAVYAPQLAASFGYGTTATAAIQLGITIAGNVLVNALFPPPSIDIGGAATSSAALTIAGTQNQAKYDQPVQRIYGVVKNYPPLGAQPYTISLGGVQYIYMLFDLGYGSLDVTELKIGDTPLTDYNEVTYNVVDVSEESNLQFFSNDIDTETVNATLNDGDPATIRTSATTQKYIQFDLILNSGLIGYNNKGDELYEDITFGYTLKDENDVLINPADYTFTPVLNTAFATVIISQPTTSSFKLSAFEVNGFSVTLQIKTTITTDFIKLSLTRTSSSSNGTSTINNVNYASIRTFKTSKVINPFRIIDTVSPTRLTHTMVEMRVRATDQLNGVINSFNCVAVSKLRTYDGTNITAPVATNNPAWIYADILTGTLNQRPKLDANINWNELKRWADFCDTLSSGENGISSKSHTCNFVLDYSSTIYKLLKDVAAIGRASPDIYDDMYSVIFEEQKTTKIQLFTNSNSSNFTSNIMYAELPDAVKVNFRDPESDWQMRELIVYNDNFTNASAKIYESIDSPMTTSSDEAYRNGRYWLKQAALRREEITFDCDLEWLECKRGDLVGYQHDVMKVGGTSMRIKTVVGTVVTVDTDPGMNGNNIDYFELRPNNGLIVSGYVAYYNVADKYTIDIGVNGAQIGDLLIVNTSGLASYDLLVKTIDVNSDQSASITCVQSVPALFDLASEAVPTYTPKIGVINTPNAIPVVLSELKVVEKLEVKDKISYITVTLLYQPGFGTIPVNYKIFKQDSDGNWVFVGNTDNEYYVLIDNEVAPGNPILGVTSSYAVTAVAESGGFLDAQSAKQITITPSGDTTAPTVPDIFTVEDTSEKFRRFFWAYEKTTIPNDLAGFIIKYTRSSLQDWGSATKLHDGLLLEPPFEIRALPAGAQTVMIRSVDTSNNESTTSRDILFTLADRVTENVLFTNSWEASSPSWDGFTVIGNPTVDGSNRLTADTTTSTLMWGSVASVLFFTTNISLMWQSTVDSFKWISNVTTPKAGITTINWTGDGEIRALYGEGTYPTDFIQTENLVSDAQAADNVSWTKENVTVTPDNTTSKAPDGTSTADKIVNNTTNAKHRLKQSPSYTGQQTASIYIKAGALTTCRLQLWNATDGVVAAVGLNLTTGATSNITGTADVESLNDGWYRLYCTGTSTIAGNTYMFYPGTETDVSFAGNTSDELYVWGMMTTAGTLIDFYPLSELIYTGNGQGVIQYTSPVNLTAGDYFLIVDSAKSVDINRLNTLKWTTDVPDINEYFSDSVVSATGDTILTLTKSFTAVTNVNITLQSDGNNADSVRIISKTTTAIKIRTYSGVSTQVAGLVDVRVQGY